MIKNYEELYASVGVKNAAALEKAIYKGTSCGAACRSLKTNDGVIIGSIVEGVDGDGTEYHELRFPFDIEDFWDIVQLVEEEADAIMYENSPQDVSEHK
jgi:hypothetical protein